MLGLNGVDGSLSTSRRRIAAHPDDAILAVDVQGTPLLANRFFRCMPNRVRVAVCIVGAELFRRRLPILELRISSICYGWIDSGSYDRLHGALYNWIGSLEVAPREFKHVVLLDCQMDNCRATHTYLSPDPGKNRHF